VAGKKQVQATSHGFVPQPEADGAWLAPAKLNLMLRVLGRRPDGYHRLQTVFQFLDHCDRLYFDAADDARIERTGGLAEIPPDQDLIVRAAWALRSEAGRDDLGVRVALEKRLPMGGGLGGGSSDAATTLHALNHLWGLGLGIDALARIGLTLGADVPVFVRGYAAWAEGVGEELRMVEADEPWYLVLAPDVHVSTAAVFSDPELTRDSSPITMADFIAGDQANDCWPVVQRRYAPVAEAFEWLAASGGQPRLTGTGGCVFSTFESEQAAQGVLGRVPRRIRAFVAKGCNRSPLFAAALA
jgi:4-diphosphocytidyl-2-C-methyl-D-erythritol kinase